MLGIAAVWAAGGAAAAVYWRALRRAQQASPPMPVMDPLLTVRYDASIGLGSWWSGNRYSGEVLLDARHLVLALSRRHRAVLERAQVRSLTLHGVFGHVVEHDGAQRLTFGLRRRDREAFTEQARRLGWPLADVGHRFPPPG